MNIKKIFFILSSACLVYSSCSGDQTEECNGICYNPNKSHCEGSTIVQGAEKNQPLNKIFGRRISPRDDKNTDCWSLELVNPYPCCTNPDTKVIYTDEDGEWGMEDGEFCGIDTNDSQTCWATEFGYNCCSDPETKIIFVDEDGEWGREDDKWCGLTTDISKPEITTTTKRNTQPTNTSTDEDYEGYKLVFSDEFNGNSLDRSKWTPEVTCWGGGNGEKECYVDHPETIFVENGALHLKAIYVGSYQLHGNDQCTLNNENSCSWTQPVISGKINTHSNGHAWKYGKVRVKALLPSGPFLWPAIWMLPQDYVYGGWAASGEIDILEARGQEPDILSYALHFGGEWPNNTYLNKIATKKNAGNEWHVYGVDYERDYIRFSVDDVETAVFDLRQDFYSGRGDKPYTDIRQPFDQAFHLLLNVAVGGNFFDQNKFGTFNPEVHPKQWTRSEMVIDYVRVYQRK